MSDGSQFPKDVPFFFFDLIPETTTTNTVVAVCLAVAWVTMALRFWTRAMLVKVFGADDAFMGLTVVLFTIYCGGVFKICAIISGKASLTLSQLELATSLLIMCECFYIVTMLFLKISLSVFFLRIMVRTWQRRMVQISVFLATTFGTVYFFFAIFQCGAPVTAYNIIRKMLLKQCLSSDEILGMAYTHASITLATDLVLALIPMAMLHGSQMTKREKWVVYFILSLGTIGAVASALRIQYIRTLTVISPSFFTQSLYLTIWSTVEPALGIAAACLATLRKLFGWTSQQISRVGSGLRSRVTGTQVSHRPHGSGASPYGRKFNSGSFPTETSQIDLVEEAELEHVDEKQTMNANIRDVVAEMQWHPDIEMAAAPSLHSGSSRTARINEAYG